MKFAIAAAFEPGLQAGTTPVTDDCVSRSSTTEIDIVIDDRVTALPGRAQAFGMQDVSNCPQAALIGRAR